MAEFRSNLAEKVQEALAADERTAGLTVDVTDKNGVITLEGRAPSDKARRAAGEVAKGVHGVSEVINDLHLDEEGEVESPLPATLAGDEERSGVSDTLP